MALKFILGWGVRGGEECLNPASQGSLPSTAAGPLGIKLFDVFFDHVRETTEKSGELDLAGFRPVGEKSGEPLPAGGEDSTDGPASFPGELEASRPTVVHVAGSAHQTGLLEVLCLARHGWRFDLQLLCKIGQSQARSINIKDIEDSHAGSIDVDTSFGKQMLVESRLFERSSQRVERRLNLSDRHDAPSVGHNEIGATLEAGHSPTLALFTFGK